MYWQHNEELQFIQFPALAEVPCFFHAIYLRDGKCRPTAKRSLNVGLGCGDSDAQVWENRQHILAHWDQPTGVFARQVHGVEVGAWSASSGQPISNNAVIIDGDALITNCPQGALIIQTADCQPVILMDPLHRVVANIHSGWRGSVQNIIGRTIAVMTDRFGTRPADLLAGIGPSLGPCCGEFINYRRELPASIWPYRGKNDRFDFWQLSVDQLCQAGLKRDHIHLAGICTQCNPHLFFSYRAENKTGRFATVVGIRPQVP